MSVPQYYQNLTILLCFILFFGIAKCDTVNVNCLSTQNCQSDQSWYASSVGQARTYDVLTLGAGYQILLDIDVSKDAQDWSLTIQSSTGQVTVSVLVDGQTVLSPYTDYAMTGALSLSQNSESSRYVRFQIKNLNAILSTTVEIDLSITRFVAYNTHFSEGSTTGTTKIPWGIIIIAVAGAIALIIIISITVCCIRWRRRLAKLKRTQTANRSTIDPISSTTQFNNTSFQQQTYIQDRSFNPQQFGQPVNPQLGFGQPTPQYNQFIQPQLQRQPQQITIQMAP